MKPYAHLFVLRIFCVVFFWMGIFLSAQELPPPESIVEELEKSIQVLEGAFDRESQQIRTDYLNQLTRLEASAIEQRLWTLGIWAHRQQRKVTDWEGHWIAVLAEEYHLPEALTQLHENTRTRVTQLREQKIEQIIGFEKASADRLVAMEKRHVQLNNIDLAVATRAVSERIPKLNSAALLKKRLLAYDPVKARAHLEKKRGKPEVKEQGPTAPPDARFPFRGDNVVFQVFLRTVSVESAGFHAGPSSGIAIGEKVRLRGTRGLAVVAMVDREAVLQDTYDTYAEETESERLIHDLGRLPYGALVVMAARDDATRRFSGAAQSALFRLGAAKGIQKLPYRSSYILIGLKGLAPGEAHEESAMKKLVFPEDKDTVTPAEG